MRARLARFASLARTLPRLGLGNVMTVALYRLALKSGLAERLTPDTSFTKGELLSGRFLPPPPAGIDVAAIRQRGFEIASGQLRWFSAHIFPVGSPPDWFRNPFNGVRASATERHWSRLPDFDSALGDIKTIWEPSRFDWFGDLVRATRATGDQAFLCTANAWCREWSDANPPYRGHNWKCGQETSLRMLTALHGAWLAGEIDRPTDALVSFIAIHLARIRPSLAYAVAQDNNHGTSEAAALWVGGLFLLRHGPPALGKRARGYADVGKRCLVERIGRLVMDDGSFSQHSVNYHRLFLDTVSLAVLLLRALAPEQDRAALLPPAALQRLERAVVWLDAMTVGGGSAPNLGANDGARLMQTASTAYPDMRPHIALASLLLTDKPLREDANALTTWLGAGRPEPGAAQLDKPEPVVVRVFNDGGYAILSSGRLRAILRLPRYRFRPSHADALHLDIWHGDTCVSTDAGTWSYAATSPGGDLAATSAHATISIDGRSQMPRLGRFLFGDWLDGSWERRDDGSRPGIVARYRDVWGASHERSVAICHDGIVVRDEVNGARQSCTLNWPLAGSGWILTANGARSGTTIVSIRSESVLSLSHQLSLRASTYLCHEETFMLVINFADCSCVIETRFDFANAAPRV